MTGILFALNGAVAMSLYEYNVSALERAQRLYDHFNGQCMEVADLVDFFTGPKAKYWATELPLPTAFVYLLQAMNRYGDEAQKRIVVELGLK